MAQFVSSLNTGTEMYLNPNESLFDEIWNNYERVIMESLITSFGLNGLVEDVYGGDVDTIHNVERMTGADGMAPDENLKYKNSVNEKRYTNRKAYDRTEYHSQKKYTKIVSKAREEFNEKGIWLDDTYVPGNKLGKNKALPRNKQAELDHVVAAEKIHNDPVRILARLNGKNLANNPRNLRFINAELNRSKSNMTADEFIEYCQSHPGKVKWGGAEGEPLPKEVALKIKAEETRVKTANREIAVKRYYHSKRFRNDVCAAAGKQAADMAIRQALGLVLLEIYFSVKKEMHAMKAGTDILKIFKAIGRGIKKGAVRAKKKWQAFCVKLGEGFLDGILASLTTTLINCFATTKKNIVRIIRETYASIVQAGKIVLFNPDNLLLGDRIKAATIILATGASIVAGAFVSEMVAKTAAGAMPVIGQIVQIFVGTLVTGLLSCTLLLMLDRSKFINKLVSSLNMVATEVGNFEKIADAFERLAAKIAKLDIKKFSEETKQYNIASKKISEAKNESEVTLILQETYKKINIAIPWKNDFDSFMGNKDNCLEFN